MAHAVFHKCFHVAEPAATVVAFRGYVESVDRFLLHQVEEPVGQLDLAGTGRYMGQDLDDVGRKNIAAYYREVERCVLGS